MKGLESHTTPTTETSRSNELIRFLANTDGLKPYDGPFGEYISEYLLVPSDKSVTLGLNTLKNDTPYSNRVINFFRIPPAIAQAASEEKLAEISAKERFGERIELLKRLLGGRPVIDIGAGSSENGYELASLGDASAYYAIEPFYGEKLAYRLQSISRKNGIADQAVSEVPFLCIAEDVRKAISRFPGNSVSIMSFGIDHNVMGRISREDKDQITQEIIDKLALDGVYISDAVDYLRPNSLTVVETGDPAMDELFNFFTKPK